MKQSIITVLVVAALAFPLASRLLAEEKSVTGQAACIGSHQTLIKVEEGGRTVTYYLVENDVSKKFHGKVCKAPVKVKATGDVKDSGGKLELTATTIEMAN